MSPLQELPWSRTNWQSFPVFLRPGAPLTQRAALQHLLDRGVACKRGVSNAHQEPAYTGRGSWALPESEWLRDNTILLPLFHGMTQTEQDCVIDAVMTLQGARM